MRLLICAPLLLAACSAGSDNNGTDSLIRITGHIADKKLDEISGLAKSSLENDLYWAINDDGPARISALDPTGAVLGQVRIRKANNRDWEDIASFSHNGSAYLAIADIGDNDSKHEHVMVYVVPEPDVDDDEIDIAWQLRFTYPDGAVDAESLAVDARNAEVYVLSKREVPAVLYRLPLIPPADEIVMATRLGALDSLPQPSKKQLKNAKRYDFAWQATGMDFAADNGSALVLTYAGIYYYSRVEQQTWHEALQGQALELRLGKYKNAESITFATDGHAAVVTVEQEHAPLLRIDLRSVIDADIVD